MISKFLIIFFIVFQPCCIKAFFSEEIKWHRCQNAVRIEQVRAMLISKDDSWAAREKRKSRTRLLKLDKECGYRLDESFTVKEKK